METMLTPVDEPLIRALSFDAPCRIVYIGCGGDGTTLEVLRRAPAGSVVQGFDRSPALIDLDRDVRRIRAHRDGAPARLQKRVPSTGGLG